MSNATETFSGQQLFIPHLSSIAGSLASKCQIGANSRAPIGTYDGISLWSPFSRLGSDNSRATCLPVAGRISGLLEVELLALLGSVERDRAQGLFEIQGAGLLARFDDVGSEVGKPQNAGCVGGEDPCDPRKSGRMIPVGFPPSQPLPSRTVRTAPWIADDSMAISINATWSS